MKSEKNKYPPRQMPSAFATPPKEGNTFYIKTFGCQMNVYDGQQIEKMLRARGLTATDDVAAADLIILNTCAVREKASNKVFSELGRIRDAKKPDALFGIVGCVAREEGANAFKRIPELNFVLGPQTYHKLSNILDNPDARLLNVDLSGLEKFDELFPSFGGVSAKADGEGLTNAGTSSAALSAAAPQRGAIYIPIQEGCDHCCTYCIVPFTRGREISRPFDDVMRDVRAAAAGGAIEICFLGQNVNGYKFVGANNHLPLRLADLIRETAQIDSIKRIRFTSSYPTKMSDDLIALFGLAPKLLPFLNMPIQSGSPDILRRMNRPYGLDEYLRIVAQLRAARPDIQISSDFIVGFPGETDGDFEQTLEIIRRVGYINSYSFKYSPRPHTAAATMPNQIPENIKKQRLKILDDLLTEINREFNESCVGKTMPCLIEGADKTGRNLIARTPYMQQVIVSPSAKRELRVESRELKENMDSSQLSTLNSQLFVRITNANKCSLRGEIAD